MRYLRLQSAAVLRPVQIRATSTDNYPLTPCYSCVKDFLLTKLVAVFPVKLHYSGVQSDFVVVQKAVRYLVKGWFVHWF